LGKEALECYPSDEGGVDIASLIPDSLVFLDLRARTKEAALREVAEKVTSALHLSGVEEFFHIVLEREKLGTTGCGRGVAIPHARTDQVNEIRIAFARSEAGIEYDSVDCKPVHLIFLILSPVQEVRRYLETLGELSRLLRHVDVRERLLRAKDAGELKRILREAERGAV